MSFPEYRRDNGPIELYARGGFGALANPASFHNEMVRELRLRAMLTALPLFGAVNTEEKRNRRLEQIPDRMLYRHPTRKPVPESWHRDVSLHLFAQQNEQGKKGHHHD